MSESAEALAANLSSRRNITIEIINLSSRYRLINPKVYLNSGHVHSPPQPTVKYMKTEVCSFSKISAKSSGAVGVLTYDLFNKQQHEAQEKVAIMFSVPYDYNMYKNWMALGIFGKDGECDEKLYKTMYYDKEPQGFVRQEANGCGLTHKGRNLDVKGVMSPLGRCIMKVEVWDKLFCEPGQQQY